MSLTILHVIDSGGLFGAESVLVELVDEQRKQGINAIVCSIGLPGENEKPLERVLKSRGLPFWPERMKAGLNFLGALRILQRARVAGVNVLHSHGYKSDILFGFLPRSWRGMPMVATLHGWTYMGGLNKMALYTWLDVMSLRFMDAVAIVSDGMLNRRELKTRKLQNLRVIENGIPLVAPGLTADDPVSGKLREMQQFGPLIGSIGRLSKEKGFDVLLRAVAQIKKDIPSIQLALLGSGPCLDELNALAAELGILENVWFAGYVENAGRYIPLFRAYINSSFTEGMPITLLEAMRAKCPIVASNVGGIPQLLENEAGGALCKPGDPLQLSLLISSLLKSDGGRVMAEYAFQRFQQHFSITSTVHNYSRLYEDCMRA